MTVWDPTTQSPPQFPWFGRFTAVNAFDDAGEFTHRWEGVNKFERFDLTRSAQAQDQQVDAAWFGFDPAKPSDENQVALQAALDTGNLVLINKIGTYNIDPTVVFGDNYRLFIGGGVILRATDALPGPLFFNADPGGGNTNIQISGNGRIDGNAANRPVNPTDHNIYFDNTTLSSVVGIVSDNAPSHGLSANTNCQDISFIQCSANGNDRIGIRNGSTDGIIRNCTSRNNGQATPATGQGYGFWLDGARVVAEENTADGNYDDGITVVGEDCRIQGGTYRGSTGPGGHGCHVSGATGVTHVVRAKFLANAVNGLEISGSETRVDGVTCANNVNNGILLTTVTDEVRVENSDCFGNTQRGIRLLNATGKVVISNVTTKNNTLSGIYVDDPCQNVQITESKSFDDQVTKTQDWGLEIESGARVRLLDSEYFGNVSGGVRDIAGNNNGLVFSRGNFGNQAPPDFPTQGTDQYTSVAALADRPSPLSLDDGHIVEVTNSKTLWPVENGSYRPEPMSWHSTWLTEDQLVQFANELFPEDFLVDQRFHCRDTSSEYYYTTSGVVRVRSGATTAPSIRMDEWLYEPVGVLAAGDPVGIASFAGVGTTSGSPPLNFVANLVANPLIDIIAGGRIVDKTGSTTATIALAGNSNTIQIAFTKDLKPGEQVRFRRLVLT